MKAMQMIKSNRFIIFILMMLFCIRLFKLDADGPTNNVLQQYLPDEGHYAMQATNYVMRQEMEEISAIDEAEGFQVWNTSVSFLNTVFCTVSLFLFGDNYYGWRMAAFFAGLIAFFLMLKMISDSQESHIRFALIAVGLMAVFNFPFIMSCRFLDPCNFRMVLIMATTFYVWDCRRKQSALNYFVLGSFSALCITWGYLTNLFVFVPCGVLLLLDNIESVKKKRKITWSKIAGIFLGVAVTYIVSDVLLYITHGYTFTENAVQLWQVMGNRVSWSLQRFINNIIYFLGANVFGYNAAFFVLSLLAVLYCCYKGFREKNYFLIYISSLVIGFAAQSVFTEDFLIHKSIVIYPVLLLNVAFALMSYNPNLNNVVIKDRWHYLIIGSSILFSALALRITVYRLSLLEQTEMNYVMKTVFLCINVIGVVLFILFILFKELQTKPAAYIVLVVVFIVPHLVLSYEYIVKAGYENKKLMIALGEIVGDDYVMGGYPYGYCLYNDFVPISSTYDKYIPEERSARAKVLVRNDKVNYYVGPKQPEIIDEWVENSGYHWEMIKVFKNFDGDRELYVYKKVSD